MPGQSLIFIGQRGQALLLTDDEIAVVEGGRK